MILNILAILIMAYAVVVEFTILALGIASGFVPHLQASALYVAIGMIGATVMPHNLYLHSSLVQSRAVSNTFTGKSRAPSPERYPPRCWWTPAAAM